MPFRSLASLAIAGAALCSLAFAPPAQAQATCPGFYTPPNGTTTFTMEGYRLYSDVVSTYGNLVLRKPNSAVEHTGGIVNVNGHLDIQDHLTEWAISGGSLQVNGMMRIGHAPYEPRSGQTYFKQSGGVVNANVLTLGAGSGNGHLHLSGGEFRVGHITPGPHGGSLRLNGGLLVTSCAQTGSGNYGAHHVYFNGTRVRAQDGYSNPVWFQSFATTNIPLGYYIGNGGAIFDTASQTMGIPADLQHQADANAYDGGVRKLGSGSLRLGGNNSYTGGTSIEEGTLIVSSSANLGAANNGFGLYGGTLRVEGTAFTSLASRSVDTSYFLGTIDIAHAANTFTIPHSSGNGNHTSFTKTGPGTLVLTGRNNWSNGTLVNQGTLRLGGTPADGVGTLRGGLTVTGATVELSAVDAMGYAGGQKIDSVYLSGAVLDNQAAGNNGWGVAYSILGSDMRSNGGVTSTTSPSNLTFGNYGSLRVLGGMPSTLRGHVNLRSDSSQNTDVTVDENYLNVFAGISSGPGAAGITKKGDGVMALRSANTFTGNSVVQRGELAVVHPLALQNSTAVLDDGVLAFRDVNAATLGGLAGARPLLLNNTDGVNVALGVGNNNANTTYGGAFSGGGSLAKVGTGTLTLTGASSHGGGTTVSGGRLQLGSTAGNGIGAIRGALTIHSGATVTTSTTDALGWAGGVSVTSIAINGGVLENTAAGSNGWGVAYALNGATVRSNGGTPSIDAASNLSFGGPTGGNTSVSVTGSTPSTLAGHIVLRGDNGNTVNNFTVADGARLNVSAGISSINGIQKLGAGTMALEFGNNTYSGTTQVSAGTLLVTGSTGTGAVSVGSGAILAGNGQIRGAATIHGGGRVAPGNTVGTLTFGNGLTLGNGAVIQLDLGSSSDRLRISGGAFTGSGTGGVTLHLADSGGFAPGSYTLIDFAGASASGVDAADFVLGTVVPGPYDHAIAVSGSTVVLTVTLRDTTPPRVTAVGVPAARTYRANETLEFAVTFDEPTLVVGMPRLALTLNSGVVHAGYVSGSGSQTLLFRHVIAAGSNDPDGIVLGNTFDPNGGTLRDAAGNNALPALNGVPATAGIRIDTLAPSTTAVVPPPDASYAVAQPLDFTVRFSEAVAVTGAPRLTLQLTSGNVFASYVSGSGSSDLLFRHLVAAPELDADGIGLANAIDLNGGTLKDIAGNNATLTLNAIPSLAGVRVDAAPPNVIGLSLPADGLYGPDRDLDIGVVFDEPVFLVGAAPRLPVVLDSGTVYADYVAGAESATLQFRYTTLPGDNDADGIGMGSALQRAGTLRDGNGNDATLALADVPAGNAVRIDTLAPNVQAISVVGSPPAGSSAVDFAVTFSEAVTGVVDAHFVLTTLDGAADGRITGITGSDASYTVSVTGIAGQGTLRVDLRDDAGSILDLAGNAVDTGFTDGQTFSADVARPVCHVDADASGANNGRSWADAYSDLQSALPAATRCDAIWMAAGVYRAGSDGFTISRPVRVYGGFAGIESSLAERTAATIAAHPTVLSGDTDGDDGTDADGIVLDAAGLIGSNRGVVVDLAATQNADATLLDGLTITAADGHGLRCVAASGQSCNYALTNVVFSGNRGMQGAGLYNAAQLGGDASPTLDRVLFRGNHATSDASAMFNAATGAGATASPLLDHVVFTANHGNGVFVNLADGGVANPDFAHGVLVDNGMDISAAAITSESRAGGSATVTLLNSVLWDNDGVPMRHVGTNSHAAFSHSIVQGSAGSGAGWLGAGDDLGGNRDADPVLGTLGWFGGAIPGFLPRAGSAAIDAGADCATHDHRGVARPQGAACDIGATEVRQHALQVSVTGSGFVSTATPSIGDAFGACSTAGSPCTGVFAETTVVAFSVHTAPHAHFVGWIGDCGSNGRVTMDDDKLCAAEFADNTVDVVLERSVGSSPAAHGTTLAFTATLTPNAPATTTPTGTVTFLADGTPLASAPLVDGIATLHADTLLGVGTHTLTARYDGDERHLAASQPGSNSVSQQVTRGSGNVQFGALAFTYDGAAHAIDASLVEDTDAICVVTPAMVGPEAGSHPLTATCDGANYTASGSAIATIDKASGTVVFGDTAFTYDGSSKQIPAHIAEEPGTNCVVTPSSIGPGAGTYNVSATCDGTNHTASGSTTASIAKAVGTVEFTADAFTYDGTSKTVTARIAEEPATACVVTPSSIGPGAGTYSVSATCDGTDYTASGGTTASIAKAVGTVEFTADAFTYDGTAKTVTARIAEEPATACVVTPASIGPDAGDYPVDALCDGVNHTANGDVTATIARAAQSIDFAALPPRTLPQSGFSVSASGGGSGQPVTFVSLTGAVCSTTGSHGSTIILAATGTCTLRAAQDGDGNHLPAATVDRSFVVSAGSVVVTLQSSRPLAHAGEAIDLTATVSGDAPGGSVRFVADGNDVAACGAVALTGTGDTRAAVCTTASLAAGSHQVQALYAGDGNNAPGSSAPITQTISALPTIAPIAAQRVLEDGSLGPLTITLADAETAADALTLDVAIDDDTLVAPTGLVLGGSGNTRTLHVTPRADAFGSATVTLVVTDADGAPASTSFVLTIAPVNDAPSLTLADDTLLHDAIAATHTHPAFATATPGPANEAGQAVHYTLTVSSDPQAVLSTAQIASDGTLSYGLTGSAGEALLRVTATDDGGRADGGIDSSRREVRIIVGAGVAMSVRIYRVAPTATLLADAVAGGASLAEYVIETTNHGPSAVDGVRLDVNVSAALQEVLWECSAPRPCAPVNGSVPATGNRTIDTQFTLAAGETARVQLSGRLDSQAQWLELAAEATLPAGVQRLGPVPRYVLIEPVGASALYRNGFE